VIYFLPDKKVCSISINFWAPRPK